MYVNSLYLFLSPLSLSPRPYYQRDKETKKACEEINICICVYAYERKGKKNQPRFLKKLFS